MTSVSGPETLRSQLLAMGLVPGVSLTLMARAPMGDPLEIEIRGYALSLRGTEAGHIGVELTENDETPSPETEDAAYTECLHELNPHPGLGEEGKYHRQEDNARALPKDASLSFAIMGQPNSGKTTLFNQLTGAKRRVGNFPGVTVENSSAPLKFVPGSTVTDMPGLYTLSAHSREEAAARHKFLDAGVNCIINIVDAGNIERNLYLTVQLIELGIPMVLALNMMDEVRSNGGRVRVNDMESILGIPVVPITASSGEGVRELVDHAVHVARYREAPSRLDFCSALEYGGAVHRCLHSISHIVEDHAQSAGIPPKFAATAMVEGDKYMGKLLKLGDNDKEAVERIVCEMESQRGLDRQAAIADMRFSFISDLCRRTVRKPVLSRELLRSRSLDKVLTGKWTSIPVFLAIVGLILWLSIDVLGFPLQNLLSRQIAFLSSLADSAMHSAGVSPVVRSLVTDAVFGGVGAVISFIPVILVLFFFLSILEDSGYMSRVAFVTDKLLRRVGLSGRSIIPLLIGFGCSVPAVMTTRTLPSARDRRLTVMLIPFMSCSAKITVYVFLASAFFPGHTAVVLICLYLTAIAAGLVVALVRRLAGAAAEPAPLVMEMPNYRLPGWKNVGHLLWDKIKDFLRMACSVILIASIVIWLLQTFDFRFNMVEAGNGSILSAIGDWLSPLFRPVGLDDWRIVTSLISGFLAKGSVVSTLQVLGATGLFTVPTAVSMLLFCLLYTPCVATIAAVRREFGLLRALSMILFQCAVAWVVAFAGYRIALLVI